MDAQIGRIQGEVERLGLEDNLLTIAISDHGASTGGGAATSEAPLYSGRSLADVLHDAVFSEGEFPRIHPGQRQSVRSERVAISVGPVEGPEAHQR